MTQRFDRADPEDQKVSGTTLSLVIGAPVPTADVGILTKDIVASHG